MFMRNVCERIHAAGVAVAVAVAVAALLSIPVAAEEKPDQNKWQYHLFNPTPPELLRALNPDRPDVTESPNSVDAGHVQIEMSFAEYTDGDDAETFALLPTNVKLGLLNNADLQFVFTPYVNEDLDDGRTNEGFDDVQLRLKVNLWGNDGGPTALGLLPFIQLPVGASDLTTNHAEGGVAVPFSVDLGDPWSLGLMLEVDWPFDEEDDDYDTEFLHTAAIGRELIGRLGGYVEYIGVLSGDADTDYEVSLGTGLTFEVNANFLLDLSVIAGLTSDADDVKILAGTTFRF